jgi:hypothetical protein
MPAAWLAFFAFIHLEMWPEAPCLYLDAFTTMSGWHFMRRKNEPGLEISGSVLAATARQAATELRARAIVTREAGIWTTARLWFAPGSRIPPGRGYNAQLVSNHGESLYERRTLSPTRITMTSATCGYTRENY